jgi:hypothetical protein
VSYLLEHDKHYQNNEYPIYWVLYLESYLGGIQIEQCSICPYMFVMCEHKYNNWNEEGTQLTCDLCGEDGT